MWYGCQCTHSLLNSCLNVMNTLTMNRGYHLYTIHISRGHHLEWEPDQTHTPSP